MTLQNAAVGLNLVLIAGLVAVGLLSMPQRTGARPLDPPEVSVTAFAVTLVWISFAYSGWNATVYVAGELRDPERNVPRSLVLATAVVTVVYLALNAVFLYSAPAAQLAGRAEIGAIAAEALGGDRLRRAVSAVIALALFASISSMVMAGARVYARMAEDGVLPRRFIMGHEVPTAAVALQVGLAVLMVWVSGLTELLGYIDFTLGLSAAVTVGGLIALRYREGPQRVPTPGYPWIPGLFILFTVSAAGLMAARQPFLDLEECWCGMSSRNCGWATSPGSMCRPSPGCLTGHFVSVATCRLSLDRWIECFRAQEPRFQIYARSVTAKTRSFRGRR